MAREKYGCLETSRYIDFCKPETKEYFEWLDELTPYKFKNVFPYEWNKMLLLFGKGEENYKPNLTTEEMEEIYGGD